MYATARNAFNMHGEDRKDLTCKTTDMSGESCNHLIITTDYVGSTATAVCEGLSKGDDHGTGSDDGHDSDNDFEQPVTKRQRKAPLSYTENVKSMQY